MGTEVACCQNCARALALLGACSHPAVPSPAEGETQCPSQAATSSLTSPPAAQVTRLPHGWTGIEEQPLLLPMPPMVQALLRPLQETLLTPASPRWDGRNSEARVELGWLCRLQMLLCEKSPEIGVVDVEVDLNMGNA